MFDLFQRVVEFGRNSCEVVCRSRDRQAQAPRYAENQHFGELECGGLWAPRSRGGVV
jgi:hypothetical protein